MLFFQRDAICRCREVSLLAKCDELFGSRVVLIECVHHVCRDESRRIGCPMDLDDAAILSIMLTVLLLVQSSVVRAAQDTLEEHDIVLIVTIDDLIDLFTFFTTNLTR